MCWIDIGTKFWVTLSDFSVAVPTWEGGVRLLIACYFRIQIFGYFAYFQFISLPFSNSCAPTSISGVAVGSCQHLSIKSLPWVEYTPQVAKINALAASCKINFVLLWFRTEYLQNLRRPPSLSLTILPRFWKSPVSWWYKLDTKFLS